MGEYIGWIGLSPPANYPDLSRGLATLNGTPYAATPNLSFFTFNSISTMLTLFDTTLATR